MPSTTRTLAIVISTIVLGDTLGHCVLLQGDAPARKVRSYDISFKRKLQITEFSDFWTPWPSTTKFFGLHYDQTSDQGPIQHLHLSEGFNLT